MAIKKLNLQNSAFVNNSLKTDNGELYCTCVFQTPVDMDDSTGLPRVDGRYTVSKFSGMYKILTVDNEFSRGQFIQTIDAVRVFNNNKKKDDKRPDTGAGAGRGVAAEKPAARAGPGRRRAACVEALRVGVQHHRADRRHPADRHREEKRDHDDRLRARHRAPHALHA